MPSTKEVVPVSAIVSARGGAGGEPLGELPAPALGSLMACRMRSAASFRTRSLTSCWLARGPEEIFGPGGVFGQLTKRLVERALEVELTDHLGYEPRRSRSAGG